MTTKSFTSTTYSTDAIEVVFRDNNPMATKKIIKKTITEIFDGGQPVDSQGNILKAISAKIKDNGSIVFVSNLDAITVNYEDDTSQGLTGFLEEMDGTPILEITYNEITRIPELDDDDYDE